MRLRSAFPLLVFALASQSNAQIDYPPTKTVDVKDTYFGRTYSDPYRWLEDLKDPETIAWFKAQTALADDTLSKIPGRNGLFGEWTALDKLKPAAYRMIYLRNGRMFYKKTLGGEKIGKLYYREGWNGSEKLLFDPATYKKGVATNVERQLPSYDGHYVALGLSSGGAEIAEIRVLDVDNVALLPESYYPTGGPISWTLDSKAFFYGSRNGTDPRSLEFKLNRKVRLHKLRTEFAADPDFFSNARNPDLGIEPKEGPGILTYESAPEYMFGVVGTVQSEVRMYYAPTPETGQVPPKWEVLCKTSDNLVNDLYFHDGYAYAVTHTNAPNYRLIRTSLAKPDWKHAEELVAEHTDAIQSVTETKDYLFIVYSNGVTGRVDRFDFSSGTVTAVNLPISGNVLSVLCPDQHGNRCIVSMTSWTLPVTLYDLDGDTGTFTKSVFDTAVTYPGFENLVSEEVEVPGHDGVMIPLSIVHQKGLSLDGSHSCILDGYGAYGFNEDARFDIKASIALRGVVLAFAHVRGGGEKGESWYKAGFKTTKANTWKDLISCAEFLIAKGYTCPEKLAGTGTSAGGITISRAITERPDLFAAAVCNVGCANAMRMEFTPNGPVNTPEFGTVKDPVDCAALYDMDGVQHVQKGSSYPALLGVAGWNDPRVTPWEPGKFIAAVQSASTSGKPVFMKVNYDDGHFTEDKSVTFRNFANQDAFMLWQTGHKDFQPIN
jgi:prolyl oligopeptidase